MKWWRNLHCPCLCVCSVPVSMVTAGCCPGWRGWRSSRSRRRSPCCRSSEEGTRTWSVLVVWRCRVVRWPSRQRCLCSLAAIIRPCSCVLVQEELINSIQPWLFDSSVTMEGWKLIEAEGRVRGADQGSGSGWLHKGHLFQPTCPSNRLWWIQGP